MQIENQSSNTEQKSVKKSSSSGFGFFLAVLLLLILCIIVVTATEKTQKDIDKQFSDNSIIETRVEQNTGPPLVDNQIKPLPALTLNGLKEKFNALAITGCLTHVDRAIELYNQNFIPEAFLRLQISLEHLVTQHFDVSLKSNVKGAFMKSAKNLKKAGIITERERRLLCRLGDIRNNIMHVGDYNISDIEAQKYLDRAIKITERLISLIDIPKVEPIYA